jgi:L-cysteine:1D-myo-inositol 2-amino-2-deoxy-alpha-D-glucopyranoside ligase
MVRLDGEKMSKSLGNLVFVSVLRSAGVDPMAIRLAIMAHHYRQDWDWTAAGLAEAERRLDRWRRAVALGAGADRPGPQDRGAVADPAATAVLASVRERMADDLDAPGALAAVDRWAGAVLADSPAPAAWLVADTVDALLGVEL